MDGNDKQVISFIWLKQVVTLKMEPSRTIVSSCRWWKWIRNWHVGQCHVINPCDHCASCRFLIVFYSSTWGFPGSWWFHFICYMFSSGKNWDKVNEFGLKWPSVNTTWMIIGNVEFVLGKVGWSSGLILDVTAHGGVKENDSTRKFIQHYSHVLIWDVSIFWYQASVRVSCKNKHVMQSNIPVYTTLACL